MSYDDASNADDENVISLSDSDSNPRQRMSILDEIMIRDSDDDGEEGEEEEEELPKKESTPEIMDDQEIANLIKQYEKITSTITQIEKHTSPTSSSSSHHSDDSKEGKESTIHFGNHLNLEEGGALLKEFGKFSFPNKICVYLSGNSEYKTDQIVKNVLYDYYKTLEKSRGMLFTNLKGKLYASVIPEMFMYEEYHKPAMNNLCKIQKQDHRWHSFCVIESDIEMTNIDPNMDINDVENLEHFREMLEDCGENTLYLIVRENDEQEVLWLNRKMKFSCIIMEISKDTKHLAQTLLQHRKKEVEHLERYKFLVFTSKNVYQWHLPSYPKSFKIGEKSLWKYATTTTRTKK